MRPTSSGPVPGVTHVPVVRQSVIEVPGGGGR